METNQQEANQWSMFVHLSIFAGVVVPLGGIILPIILWQIKKDQYPIVDTHGKNVVNWLISVTIYAAVTVVFCFVLIGFLFIIPLMILSIVFPIIGAIKANNGEVWKYPLAIEFIK